MRVSLFAAAVLVGLMFGGCDEGSSSPPAGAAPPAAASGPTLAVLRQARDAAESEARLAAAKTPEYLAAEKDVEAARARVARAGTAGERKHLEERVGKAELKRDIIRDDLVNNDPRIVDARRVYGKAWTREQRQKDDAEREAWKRATGKRDEIK